MKFYSIPLLIFFISTLIACSTTESTTEPTEPDEIIVDTVAPEWFNPSITSEADSIYFKGFSLSTSADSTEAIRLGNETALSNLRFEIDSYLESIRRELVDGDSGDSYQTPSFIIQLRNLVQNLDLSDSEITAVFEPDSGDLFYLYTRAVMPREQIFLQVDELIADEEFVGRVMSFEF